MRFGGNPMLMPKVKDPEFWKQVRTNILLVIEYNQYIMTQRGDSKCSMTSCQIG
jgi:hypothetical protein